MLDEGVVADGRRTSTCAMILGAGWPFHLGGVTPYLDREGVSERVTGTRFLGPGWPACRAADRSEEQLGHAVDADPGQRTDDGAVDPDELQVPADRSSTLREVSAPSQRSTVSVIVAVISSR